MDKKEVAKVLEEIAQLMELAGENTFKIRSYVNGARTIEQLDEPIQVLVEEHRLQELKGVGQALEEKIIELVTTGQLQFLEDLKAQFPPTIFELFAIPGLGPKRVKVLYDELGIDSLKGLEHACESDQVLSLKGFSLGMQEKILAGIGFSKKQEGQHLFDKASGAAEKVMAHLSEHSAVIRIELAGSLRRRKEVVKDVDIVASSIDPTAVMTSFVNMPEVERIVAQGETKSSVVLSSSVGVDLRVVEDHQFTYTLAHFTGSKEHNVVMRQRAKERGLKLNEYGLFREDGSLVHCDTEAVLFAALDLPYLPPELREDRGEFDVKATPRLVELEDMRGLIHLHTTYSDGANTLHEMATAVQEAGYEYMLVSDHSQTAAYAGGLRPDVVASQQRAIDDLNEELTDFRVLKGIESDILMDGSLDYEEEVLSSFDLIIASVHQKLDMSEEEATKRVVKAIEHPATAILGHPTGRLLLKRKGYILDMEQIFDACVANNVAVEINANCQRLDCDWRHIRRGKDKGVKFSIGPDAHRAFGITFVKYGVGIARKGWLEPEDVINSMTCEELLAWRG